MMNRRPFDLKKLDFEGIRRRRRRQLLRYSLPFCLLTFVLALNLLALPLFSHVAHRHYAQTRHDQALAWLNPLRIIDWLEPYKVLFNSGNVAFRQGNFAEAEQYYRRALETTPSTRECDVRINLALSIEAQADIHLRERRFDAAIVAYDAAKAVLRDGRAVCNTETRPESQQADTKQAASALGRRIDQKSNTAKRQRNNDAAAQENPAADTKTETTQKKLEQLEQRATEAQQQRLRSQRSRHSEVDYQKQLQRNPTAKNW